MSQAWSTEANRICSCTFGAVSSWLWFSFTMKGMRWAQRRATEPSTPSVEQTALQPASTASSTIASLSK